MMNREEHRQRIAQHPSSVRLEELQQLLEEYGWTLDRVHSSHYIFVRGSKLLSIPFKRPSCRSTSGGRSVFWKSRTKKIMATTNQPVGERVRELMGLPYRKVISGDAEEGFLAEAPELEGCFTAGETEQEALFLLLDAMEGWLTSAIEHGRTVPVPSTALATDAQYSGRILLRTSHRLHRLLAEQAQQQGVSLNQWVIGLLAEGVGRAAGIGASPHATGEVERAQSASMDAAMQQARDAMKGAPRAIEEPRSVGSQRGRRPRPAQ